MKVTKFTATFIADSKKVVFNKIPLKKGTYCKEGFILQLTDGAYTGLVFKRSHGRQFSLDSVTYDIAFPLTNAGKIIVPDTGRHFMDTLYPRKVMFKQHYKVSSAHMSTPIFIYLDGNEKVVLAFGLMGRIIDTVFSQTSPAANKKFSLVVHANECRWRIRKPYHEKASLGKMKAFEDGFYQSEGDKTWFHALRTYARIFQKKHQVKLRTNRNTYKPEFCTWRVINSDKLTHEWTVETARECRKLGIGVMILDDGWFGVGLDSTIMSSSIGSWPRKVKGKYPDIRATMDAVRKEGVHPVLWYCPTGIGPGSDLFEEVKHLLIVNDGKLYQTSGLFHTLCPRNPEAREVIRKTLQRIFSHKPDGYKPDLFNYMPISPCEADHEHDIPTILEATRVCFKMMYKESMKFNPNMVFMLKNDEANIDFCQFAPAVRSGDSPYDPNIMFLRCAYPNAFAPAVINDYFMLAGPETGEEIARCMIKQVTMGVPALSVDLLNTPERQKKVLRAWIGLYNREFKALHMAALIEPQDSGLTCWERIDKKQKTGMLSLVHPGSAIECLPDADKLFVLNATANKELFIRKCSWKGDATVTCYDFRHKKTGTYKWTDTDRKNLKVPVAGYAEIRK